MRARRRPSGIIVVAAAIVVMAGGQVAAQESAVAVLPEEAPEVVLYRLGPVLVNPRFSVPEIGRDSNVFNEGTEPKEDFVLKLMPEIDFFTELGLISVAAKSASTFTYYHEYRSERSIAEQIRARASARLSRISPWVGGASIRSNERTAEIDARAKRVERELAAGANFEITPLATLTVSVHRIGVRYDDAETFRDTLLAQSLDRTTESVIASWRFQATPFTSLTFRGFRSRDQFEFDPARNSDAVGGDAEVNFAPEAVVRGRLGLGYRQQSSDDPTVSTFRGLVGRGGISSVLVWRAIASVDYVREVQYSFDRREGYYLDNGINMVYTQRIGGPLDIQVRLARNSLTYDATPTAAERRERLWAYQAGIGYSLENGSRFGVSYELAERDSTRGDRQFERRRVFGTFTYEFWK